MSIPAGTLPSSLGTEGDHHEDLAVWDPKLCPGRPQTMLSHRWTMPSHSGDGAGPPGSFGVAHPYLFCVIRTCLAPALLLAETRKGSSCSDGAMRCWVPFPTTNHLSLPVCQGESHRQAPHWWSCGSHRGTGGVCKRRSWNNLSVKHLCQPRQLKFPASS